MVVARADLPGWYIHILTTPHRAVILWGVKRAQIGQPLTGETVENYFAKAAAQGFAFALVWPGLPDKGTEYFTTHKAAIKAGERSGFAFMVWEFPMPDNPTSEERA